MTSELTLSADWVSPPGRTIEDFIYSKGDSISDFAANIGCKVSFLKSLLRGVETIDIDLADKLESATGASREFWLNRESQYRESIESVKIKEESEYSWLSELPTADMANFGWIQKFTTRKEKILECFRFFGVVSVEEWQMKYHGVISETAFRTSPIYSSKIESIAAWLRQGEIEANDQECDSWNRELLEQLIPSIRELTNLSSPEEFLPLLKDYLKKCGVAFSVVKAPRGCSASGATYWLNEEKALVILSIRHLSDDHFWFTLFHELGHLILHSDHSLILESADTRDSEIEREANQFSEDILIPKEHRHELYSLSPKNIRGILKFAKKIGTSKGIVVGQMQHERIVPNNYLNKLKTRYSWS